MIDRTIYTTPEEVAYAEACERAGIEATALGLTHGAARQAYVATAVAPAQAVMHAAFLRDDPDQPDVTGASVLGLCCTTAMVG